MVGLSFFAHVLAKFKIVGKVGLEFTQTTSVNAEQLRVDTKFDPVVMKSTHSTVVIHFFGYQNYFFAELACLPQTLQDEGEADEEGEFPMAQLTAIVGAQNADICPAIIHLTLADSAYSLLATPTSEEAKDMERVEVEVEG